MGAMFRVATATVVGLVALALLLAPSPASAGVGNDGDVSAEARYVYNGRGPGGPSCSYATADARGNLHGAPIPPTTETVDTVNFGGVDTYSITVDGQQRILMLRDCSGNIQWIWALVATPENLAFDAYEQVIDLVPAPEAEFTPLDPAGPWLYVQVPTDFRLDGLWDLVSARAQVGPIWAEATATPRVLIFDPGEPGGPGPVECGRSAPGGLLPAPPNPEPQEAYDEADPGACSYVYLDSSSTAGGQFTYQFTVDWQITYDSNIGPIPPPLPAMGAEVTDFTDVIQVAEARPSGSVDGG